MTKVPLILGTMTFGIAGKSGVRTSDTKECQKLVDAFLAHGHSEIDTSRMYGDGTTEEVLSKINIQKAALDTKVFPSKPGDHAPHNLRRVFQGSLHILRPHKIRVLYLHRPDRTVPFEETCAAIDEMHKEGLFEIFGLSNYAAWEVAEIVGICKMNGYIMPKIYQAMYNPITRAIEPELVPCLRKFDIRLVIYNPLAGRLHHGDDARVTLSNEWI
ncbi:hypothetical protein FRC03_010796 [Tulasnella sp. 419]|nr:hypothetical protein FRC03_010796 [Tulasnella sp. 419]